MSEPNESMPRDVQIEDESWSPWPVSVLSRGADVLMGWDVRSGKAVYLTDPIHLSKLRPRVGYGKSFMANVVIEHVLAGLDAVGLLEGMPNAFNVARTVNVTSVPYTLFMGYGRSVCGRRTSAGSFGSVKRLSNSPMWFGAKQLAKSTLLTRLLNDS